MVSRYDFWNQCSPIIDLALEAILFGALDGQGRLYTNIPQSELPKVYGLPRITKPNKGVIGPTEVAVVFCDDTRALLTVILGDTQRNIAAYREHVRPDTLGEIVGECFRELSTKEQRSRGLPQSNRREQFFEKHKASVHRVLNSISKKYYEDWGIIVENQTLNPCPKPNIAMTTRDGIYGACVADDGNSLKLVFVKGPPNSRVYKVSSAKPNEIGPGFSALLGKALKK